MRADGRRIKTFFPMYQVAAHIMSERNDSMNMIELDIKNDPLQEYLNKKRKEGYRFSHLALVLAAFSRTVAEFPYLNRFIVNKRVYARNELTVGMVVLKPGETDETMNKMTIPRESTIYDVQKILEEYVGQNREKGETNSTDKLISTLLSIPGLCRFGVNLLKWADKHNLLPKSVIDASPFHCTMTITNLASIRTNFIYHHVYNFGTTGMILALGNMKYVPVKRHGQMEFDKCIPIGMVMDERIATGLEYAKAFERMEEYLLHPELLEEPVKEVVEDIP